MFKILGTILLAIFFIGSLILAIVNRIRKDNGLKFRDSDKILIIIILINAFAVFLLVAKPSNFINVLFEITIIVLPILLLLIIVLFFYFCCRVIIEKVKSDRIWYLYIFIAIFFIVGLSLNHPFYSVEYFIENINDAAYFHHKISNIFIYFLEALSALVFNLIYFFLFSVPFIFIFSTVYFGFIKKFTKKSFYFMTLFVFLFLNAAGLLFSILTGYPYIAYVFGNILDINGPFIYY